MTASVLQPFVTGLAFPEAPRWHAGALWFSDFHLHRVSRVTPDAKLEVMAEMRTLRGGAILRLPLPT